MLRPRILLAVGGLLLLGGLVYGLVPVQRHLTVLYENLKTRLAGQPAPATPEPSFAPSQDVTISCGSPLFEHAPRYDPPSRFEWYGANPCVERDHRRGPIELIGGAGLVVALLGVVDQAAVGGRRRTARPDRADQPDQPDQPASV